MTYFIDPTSRPNEGLVSLLSCRRDLRQFTPAQLTGIGEGLLKKHLQSGDPVARRYAKVMRNDFDPAKGVEDLIDKILVHAMVASELTAYVGRGQADRVNAVKTFFWSRAGSCADIEEVIRSGTLTFDHELSSRPIEEEANNRELMVSGREFKILLQNKTINANAAVRLGRSIAEEFIEKHGPNAIMTRGSFLTTLQSKLPGCSERQAKRVWSSVTPKTWRAPGRRKRSA